MEQGLDKDGKPKYRAIDNERGNLLNNRQQCHETITTITIMLVSLIARGFHAACRSHGVAMFALAIGLDDMARAYRKIPVSQRQCTVFVFYSMVRKRVEHFFLDGHNFGHRSAVLNFNAFPHFIVALARVLLAMPCDHFFDDFILVDLFLNGQSGQLLFGELMELLGQGLEKSKRKGMALANIGLGIQVDLRFVTSDLLVRASPTPRRIEKILHILRRAREIDWLTPAAASHVRGVCGFMFGSSRAGFGRAALQPLAQREYHDVDFRFTPALLQMVEFMEWRVVLRSGCCSSTGKKKWGKVPVGEKNSASLFIQYHDKPS